MPADERYDVAHERNKRTSADKPGCYNRGPFAKGYYAITREYFPDGKFAFKQVFIKTEWKAYPRCPNHYYDECKGCKWSQDGC